MPSWWWPPRALSWWSTTSGPARPGQRLLDGLDFTLEPGRTVAVVGETASGKSTLTSLVTRLIDPQSGSIRVDGQDLRDLAPGQLAQHVALVPQNAFLFDDTMRGNVTLGADVADEQIWTRCAPPRRTDRGRLPKGLDSRLGERGTTLSGAAAATALAGSRPGPRPRLLVIDDATCAVDPEVEARILAAIAGTVGTATVAPDRLPQGDDRPGRRRALPRRRTDRRPRHPRGASRAAPATPSSSTPTRPRGWPREHRRARGARRRRHQRRQRRGDLRPRHHPAWAGVLSRAR